MTVAVNLGVGGGQQRVVSLDPVVFLTPGETYTIHATTAVTDVSGNSLAAEFTSIFTTLPDPQQPLTVTPFPADEAAVFQ